MRVSICSLRSENMVARAEPETDYKRDIVTVNPSVTPRTLSSTIDELYKLIFNFTPKEDLKFYLGCFRYFAKEVYHMNSFFIKF